MSSEMIEYIQQTTTYSPTVVTTVMEAFYKYVQLSLTNGQEIKIKNFGNFGTSEQKERMGRNPKTGEEVWIEAKIRPYFKFSKTFRDSVQPSQLPPGAPNQNVPDVAIAPPFPPSIPPIPEMGQPVRAASAQPNRQWHFANNGNANLLREADLVKAGVTKDSLLWNPSKPTWVKAGEIPELNYLFS
jgi:DNA-binding protein HU-beta